MAAYSTDPRTREIQDRIILEPHYRIALAVANNHDDALANYQRSYATSEYLGVGKLSMKLSQIWDSGYEQAVERILDIAWIDGKDPYIDAARQNLLAEVEGEKSGEGAEKFVQFILGGLMAIGAAVPHIGAGQRERDAAMAEERRLAQIAEMQRMEQEARTQRQAKLLRAGGIALGVVAVVVILVILLRNKKT